MKSLDRHVKQHRVGRGVVYCADALTVLKATPADSVQLIVTSPPFALRRKKEYGNQSARDYVDWFLEFAKEFYRVIRHDGSLVIDLGGAYLPGLPVRSIYQFELLIRLVRDLNFLLAQDFYHFNAARLPTPAQWVTIERIRVKDAVNVVWWLSKTPEPFASNRKVLKPYSNSMRALLKNGYEARLRPSGHDISRAFRRNNGGSIPANLLQLPNTESNSEYLRRCRFLGIKPHPARFPVSFPEFFIRFLSKPGDVVMDPFAGSLSTGFAAETNKRKWVCIEIREDYVNGGLLRFKPKGWRKLQMTAIKPSKNTPEETTRRAAVFRAMVKASGLTLAEFARQAGLTRNVAYGMTKGRKASPEEFARMEAVSKRRDKSGVPRGS